MSDGAQMDRLIRVLERIALALEAQPQPWYPIMPVQVPVQSPPSYSTIHNPVYQGCACDPNTICNNAACPRASRITC